MIDYFGKKISFFENLYSTAPKDMTLASFVYLGEKYKDYIAKVRKEQDKRMRNEMKKQLPAATIAGTFQRRREDMLIEPSGLMCIDIDGQDNPDVDDWNEAKGWLCGGIENVVYGSLSLSGHGLYLIFAIKWPQYYRQQFRKIQLEMEESFGIVIDKQCGNLSRTRTISYDEQPYYNLQAVPYERYHVDPAQRPRKVVYDGSDDALTSVARCCEAITLSGTDITASYDDWYHVGMSLASLGESGREFYHAVSSVNATYNRGQTDRKFSELLRSRRTITIATFFHICKQNRISIR